MHYDFSQIEDNQSFVSVPAGTYICRVADVREGTSRDGSVRWNMRLEVATGDFAGRTAGWDSLTWSPRGMHRMKSVLSALGFDVSGALELGAQDLYGRVAEVAFEFEQREDPRTGAIQERLRVPYAGFSPCEVPIEAPEGYRRSPWPRADGERDPPEERRADPLRAS